MREYMIEKGYLGIDWGSTDVGIALADPETRIALAFATFRNDATLVDRIILTVEQEHIGTIVIGIPRRDMMRSQMGQRSHTIPLYAGETFGEQLKKRVGSDIAIVYQDEMFTTKMAQYNLIERGMKRVSQHDDSEAARIILETWLSTHQ